MDNQLKWDPIGLGTSTSPVVDLLWKKTDVKQDIGRGTVFDKSSWSTTASAEPLDELQTDDEDSSPQVPVSFYVSTLVWASAGQVFMLCRGLLLICSLYQRLCRPCRRPDCRTSADFALVSHMSECPTYKNRGTPSRISCCQSSRSPSSYPCSSCSCSSPRNNNRPSRCSRWQCCLCSRLVCSLQCPACLWVWACCRW